MSWVDVDHDDDSNSSYPTNLPVAQWRFEWSPAGDLLKKQDARPGAAWGDRDRLNAYDDLHRLEQSRVGGFADFEQDLLADAPNKSEHWALDSIGNWASLQIDSDGDGAFNGANDAEHARTHNAANEFESDNDGSTAETRFYDDSGSLGLVKVDGQVRLRYIYDAWNRLVEVQDGSDQRIVRYEYNALHWRTIATHYVVGTLDTRERFYYSPDWQLHEQHTWNSPQATAAQDDDPDVVAQQFWGKRGLDDAVSRRVDRGDGAGGPPDGDYTDAGDGSWYYVTDNLRSVSAVVNAAGTLVERVVYGPFGKSQHHFAGDVNGDGTANVDDVYHLAALTSGGATPDLGDAAYEADCDLNRDGELNFADVLLVQAGAAKGSVLGISDPAGPANPVGYAGYLYINDFGGSSGDFGLEGHWYARHRYYDPVAGRWITRDPAGYVDGMSLYLYVGGNPFGLVDPLGLGTWVGNFFGAVADGFDVIADTVTGDHATEVARSANGAASMESRLAQKAVQRGDREAAGEILATRESANISSAGAAVADQAGDAIQDVAIELASAPVGGAAIKAIDKGLDLARGVDRAADAAKLASRTANVADDAGKASVSLGNSGSGLGHQAIQLDDFARYGMRNRGSDLGARQGREFRTDALEVHEFDPNAPAHVRGWLRNERRRVELGQADYVRNPPGYVQSHGRTTPAREGFDYSNSRLQGEDLNRLEESVRRRKGSCLQ